MFHYVPHGCGMLWVTIHSPKKSFLSNPHCDEVNRGACGEKGWPMPQKSRAEAEFFRASNHILLVERASYLHILEIEATSHDHLIKMDTFWPLEQTYHCPPFSLCPGLREAKEARNGSRHARHVWHCQLCDLTKGGIS